LSVGAPAPPSTGRYSGSGDRVPRRASPAAWMC
jgi:hypothetical protein